MKTITKLFSGLLLAIASMAAYAVSLPEPISFEEQIKAVKIDIEFADRYSKHLDALIDRTNHQAVIKGAPVFYVNPMYRASSCTGGGTLGGAIYGGSTGVAGIGGISTGVTGTAASCDCPPGNRDMKCLRTISTTFNTDYRDVKGFSFYGIYAEKGDDWAVLTNDNRWVAIENTREIEYTFIRENTKPVETYLVKSAFNNICSILGNGPITIFATYGTADTMELEFINFIKRTEKDFDAFSHMYNHAGFTAMTQRKFAPIAVANCGTSLSGVLGY